MIPDPLTSMTLGQAAKEIIYLVQCEDCGRRARIDLMEMASRYGDDEPLPKLTRSLKCECASKDFIITTYWLSASTSHQVLQQWPLKGDSAHKASESP